MSGLLARRASQEQLLKQIGDGAANLKPADTAADRSAPIIEAGTEIKAAPAKAVFKELKEQGTNLMKVDHVNDRSQPTIDPWPQELKTNPRPALVEEIKAKQDSFIEQVASSHRKKQMHDDAQEIASKSELMQEIKGKRSAIEGLTDKAAAAVISEEGGFRSLSRVSVVNELREKRDSIEAALTQLHRSHSGEVAVAN